MMIEEQTVFVIDDDRQSRDSVSTLVRSMGIAAQEFDSAEAFLATYQDDPGCLVTDYRMRGMSGLELQESLNASGTSLPLIIVTAFARTPVTVQAIKNGAVTMLDKPYDADKLWQAIRTALAEDKERRELQRTQLDARVRLNSLSAKESSVLDLILDGASNKSMASELDVSLRTIENRRRKIFSKMGVDTVAELVAAVLKDRGSR